MRRFPGSLRMTIRDCESGRCGTACRFVCGCGGRGVPGREADPYGMTNKETKHGEKSLEGGKEGGPVGGGAGEGGRGGVGEGVGGEAEGAADRQGVGGLGGGDVYGGVADHHGFGRKDGGGLWIRSAKEARGFGDEGVETGWVGLLEMKAVAAVDLEEERGEGEAGADLAGWVDGLVGEDGEVGFGKGVADGGEGFKDAGVGAGVIEFVDAVVIEEEGKRGGYIFGVVEVALRVAEGTAKEHGGAIADEGADEGEMQGWAMEVGEGGVDGVGEVLLGVDEGAIKVEDYEAGHSGDCSDVWWSGDRPLSLRVVRIPGKKQIPSG